jgi:hypothetical protein
MFDSYRVSMDDVRAAHKSARPDSHWFDASTMRFFGTRLASDAYKVGPVYFFITSEQPPSGPRRHSVRRFDGINEIETVGDFCALSRSGARTRLIREVNAAIVNPTPDARTLAKIQGDID